MKTPSESGETWEQVIRDTVSMVLYGVKSPQYGKGIVETAAIEQIKVILAEAESSWKEKLVEELEKSKEEVSSPEDYWRRGRNELADELITRYKK